MKAYIIPFTHTHKTTNKVLSLRSAGYSAYVDGRAIITDAAPFQMSDMSVQPIIRYTADEYYSDPTLQ